MTVGCGYSSVKTCIQQKNHRIRKTTEKLTFNRDVVNAVNSITYIILASKDFVQIKGVWFHRSKKIPEKHK